MARGPLRLVSGGVAARPAVSENGLYVDQPRGMQCGRSSAAVGAATTSAVVTGIVFIIVSDGLTTVIFDLVGL